MTHNPYRENGQPFFYEGNHIGVLLSHGYTGTTSSMRPLGEYLHQTEGWTVLAPQLKGHGDTPEAMAETGAEDWIRSLEAGLQTLQSRCQHIFMAGLSMGGCLTLYLAAKYPQAFKAIAPINACIFLQSQALAALAYDAQAPQFISGVGSDIKDPSVQEIAYDKLPVATLRELYALTAITRDLLPAVQAPTLVLSSPQDHVVAAANSEEIIARVGATQREMLRLNNSYHVATLDFDKDVINESVRQFFKRQLHSAAAPGQ